MHELQTGLDAAVCPASTCMDKTGKTGAFSGCLLLVELRGGSECDAALGARSKLSH